ncbi:hypothetical protein ACHAXS_013971 [Conticribra weissflogii]
MSSSKILPIELPSPPSALYQNLPPSEDFATSTTNGINVHIRWKVKSGSIVHKGETIASLNYVLGGETPSGSDGGTEDEKRIDPNNGKDSGGDAPPTGSSGSAFESTDEVTTGATSQRSLIRARMKRRWAAEGQNRANPSSVPYCSTEKTEEICGNSSNRHDLNGGNKINKNHEASMQIRSPSNGFLRIPQTKTLIPNAFPLKYGKNRDSITKEKNETIILATIEPCHHPAVVGDLCAVCGYDFKSPGHEKDVFDVDADYTNGNKNDGSVNDRLLIDLSSDDDDIDDEEEESMRQRRKHSKRSNSEKRIFDSSEVIDLTEAEDTDVKSTPDSLEDATTCSKLASTDSKMKSTSATTNTPTSSEAASRKTTTTELKSSLSASDAPVAAKSIPSGPNAKSTTIRTLSSLLSGVESTRQMQQTRHAQSRPVSTMTKIRKGHNTISPTPPSSSSKSNTDSSFSSFTSATKPSTAIPKMTQMTVSGGITVTISESEAKSISEASSKKLRESKQLCLVMDLDHTLLHATDDYRAGRFVADEILLRESDVEADTNDVKIEGEDEKTNKHQKRDRENQDKPKAAPNPEKRSDVRSILLPVDLPPSQYQQYLQQKQYQEHMLQSQSKTHRYKLPQLTSTNPQQRTPENTPVNLRHYVKLRPHLKEFFEQIQSTYKLSVYTAGTRAYAEQIAVMICRHLVGASYDEEGLQMLRAKMRELDQDCKKYREYKAKMGRRRQLEMARQRGDFMEMDLETIALEIEKESLEEQGITAVSRKKEENEIKWNDKKAVTSLAGRRKGKSVSFAANLCESKAKEFTTKSQNNTPSISAGSDGSEFKPENGTNEDKGAICESKTSSIESEHSEKAESGSSNNGEHTIEAIESISGIDTVASSTASSSSSTSIKRNNVSRGGESSIPRKKKRAAPTSLIHLVPPPSKDDAAKNTNQANSSSISNDVDEIYMKDPSEERDELRKKLDEAERLEIAAVDLRRKIFGSRIVSRTDVGDLGKDVKSLKRVFPCGGVMAAIIDDREDVWANANNNSTGRPGEPPDNLLLVKPYHWKPFSGYADVNNASGSDLSKKENSAISSNHNQDDDDEEDFQLLWTADVLRRLHERYYSSSKAQQESEQISVPSVLPNVTKHTTHIVAARDGSEKIQRARRHVPGCFIVHTSWLMECYWSLTRRDVINHHMGPMPKCEHVKSNVPEPETPAPRTKILIESKEYEREEEDENDDDDDDEEDDDFAAALESELIKGDSSFLC